MEPSFMTQWIVFDAMGVIFEEGEDVENLLIPFLRRRKPGLDANVLRDAYHSASLGKIASFELWRRIGLGEDFPAIENEYLDTCLRLSPHCMEIAGRLSARFSLAIFSNDIKEWSAHLRRTHGLDRLFQAAVISGEAGFRKPAPEIFRLLLDRLHAKSEDCIYIDDRVSNLLPAAALGMIPVWLAKENQSSSPGIPYRIRTLSELPKLVEG
jgi:HAD superfamily hydrolase (TIGR01509 family)